MDENTKLDKAAAKIRELIAEARRTMTGPKGAPIEGAPIGWIALGDSDILNELVKRGDFEIVERASQTNPNRLAQFVREV